MLTVGRRPAYAAPFEVVERKGKGHPDTLCDRLAETLARGLARRMIERGGGLGHFNVDKGLLVAGETEVGPGGGRVIEPARLTLAGRADLGTFGIESRELALDVEEELASLLPDAPSGAVEVELLVNRPAAELADLTVGSQGVPLANDTSFAVVSLPRSPLEEAVHRATDHLNDLAVRERLPIGTDVKVMGHRREGRVTLTVAAPVLAREVKGEAAYREVVRAVGREVEAVAADGASGRPDVEVNAAPGLYLTLIGSSAESGDDGQVGRGNDFGGLIAPFRPRSGEAPAGKNPLSHVGKTYHAMAHDVASGLLDRAGEVTVSLLSRIGSPVTRPAAARVETLEAVEENEVGSALDAALHDWEGGRDRLLAGVYELF